MTLKQAEPLTVDISILKSCYATGQETFEAVYRDKD